MVESSFDFGDACLEGLEGFFLNESDLFEGLSDVLIDFSRDIRGVLSTAFDQLFEDFLALFGGEFAFFDEFVDCLPSLFD